MASLDFIISLFVPEGKKPADRLSFCYSTEFLPCLAELVMKLAKAPRFAHSFTLQGNPFHAFTSPILKVIKRFDLITPIQRCS